MEAIETVIQIPNVDPKKMIFMDKQCSKHCEWKAAGVHTVIVESSVLVVGADIALRSIHSIKEALPEIWEGGKEQLELLLQSTAVEAVVLA